MPQPLIDTQIAAAILNMGSAVGYGNIVKELLGKEHDTSLSLRERIRHIPSKELVNSDRDYERTVAFINELVRNWGHGALPIE